MAQSGHRLLLSAFGGEADDICSSWVFRVCQFCCDAQRRIQVGWKRNMPGRTAATALQANRVCLPDRV